MAPQTSAVECEEPIHKSPFCPGRNKVEREGGGAEEGLMKRRREIKRRKKGRVGEGRIRRRRLHKNNPE